MPRLASGSCALAPGKVNAGYIPGVQNPGPVSSPHTPIYLDTSSTVDAFLQSIGGTPILALDTEGASFHRFVDRIYLLQLSTREHTAIIDPIPIGSPPRLGTLLESPSVEIVFHDADYDLRLLHQDYGWHVRSIFDTRVAAQLLGIRAFGLAALLAGNAVVIKPSDITPLCGQRNKRQRQFRLSRWLTISLPPD